MTKFFWCFSVSLVQIDVITTTEIPLTVTQSTTKIPLIGTSTDSTTNSLVTNTFDESKEPTTTEVTVPTKGYKFENATQGPESLTTGKDDDKTTKAFQGNTKRPSTRWDPSLEVEFDSTTIPTSTGMDVENISETTHLNRPPTTPVPKELSLGTKKPELEIPPTTFAPLMPPKPVFNTTNVDIVNITMYCGSTADCTNNEICIHGRCLKLCDSISNTNCFKGIKMIN